MNTGGGGSYKVTRKRLNRKSGFTAGKHAPAWAAKGMKGRGGCQKIGVKSEAEMAELRRAGAGFSLAFCDACHTRHTFSVKEARQPQACQSCHMQEGNHAVSTAWGFLAVRLPMPEDKQWSSDRAVILKGLGVLDPDGKPTARLELVKQAKAARLIQED